MAQATTKTQSPSQAVAIAPPVENLPAPRPRTAITPIVPTTWQEVVTIAEAICRANMAPKSYCKTDGYGKMIYVDGKPVPEPEKVAIAIMHGMEVGLTPMAALQSLAVINGMPSVYGDGLLALIRASGLLEDIEESIEWAKDGPLSATCKMWRKGEKTPSIQTYTRADAQKAKLWAKAGPWTDHPARMLQWRARGWCGRDKFADVLRGLHSAEEVQDMIDITSAATVSPVEPKREDYEPQPAASPHSEPAESGQPEVRSSSGAGGDSKPEAASTPASTTGKPPYDEKESAKAAEREMYESAGVTDVVDQNEQPAAAPDNPPPAEPIVPFQMYAKAGDWFDFADPWLQDPARTEAELVAFSAFYYDWMQERISPSWKSKPVREAVIETKGFLDAAMARAQKKAKASL